MRYRRGSGSGCNRYELRVSTLLIALFRTNRLPIARKRHPTQCKKFRECVREGDVPNLDVLVAPLVEQLDAANLLGNILGEDGVAGGALDLDFAVRHVCDLYGVDWVRRVREVSGSVVVGSLKFKSRKVVCAMLPASLSLASWHAQTLYLATFTIGNLAIAVLLVPAGDIYQVIQYILNICLAVADRWKCILKDPCYFPSS